MRQKYGQNFLNDPSIARRIVEAADPGPADTVLEIGPGKGMLTAIIAPRVRKLVAVEIDRDLVPRLRERFRAMPHVEIVEGNFMDYDPGRAGDGVKVIANLPYYVSTAIVEKLLPARTWTTMTVMVQKEVAERIAAEPGSRDYGYFSVLCRYYASTELLFPVKPGSFTPPPKVDSAVLRLTNSCPPPPPAGLFAVVKAAFGQRRKTVLNSLANGLDLPRDTAAGALAAAGVDPALRAENLSLADYLRLAAALPAATP